MIVELSNDEMKEISKIDKTVSVNKRTSFLWRMLNLGKTYGI